MKLLYTLIFLFVLIFSVPSYIKASTINVSQGESIQSKCLNVVSSGDTCIVNAGSYTEVVSISKSGITLQANGNAIIRGAVEVYGNSNVVRGFEITSPNEKAGIRTMGNDNLIENNNIHNMLEDGMWLWGLNNTVRGNYIHHIIEPSKDINDPHVDCIMSWTDTWIPYSTDNLIIEGNKCSIDRASGSNQFFILTRRDTTKSIKNITIRNNIFIANSPGYVPIAFYGDSTVSGVKIINNTFYNTTGQGANPIYLSNMPQTYIANNVSIGFTESISRVINSVATLENNVIQGPYGMVNYQASNFHLASGSPLIDNGVNLANIGVVKDFDSISRPQGSAFDIGAFEFVGGVATTPTPTLTYNIADLDQDGDVDGADFNTLVSNFSLSGALGWIKSDILKNGVVDIFDFNKLITNFGL
jgi:preprotein translocase subunit YajC